MSLGICDGITTNPSIMAKDGVTNIEDMITEICKYNIEDVSVELLDPFKTIPELVDEAVGYYKVCPEKVVIKVPTIDFRTPTFITKQMSLSLSSFSLYLSSPTNISSFIFTIILSLQYAYFRDKCMC